jgi:hypothetical protein
MKKLKYRDGQEEELLAKRLATFLLVKIYLFSCNYKGETPLTVIQQIFFVSNLLLSVQFAYTKAEFK